MHLTLHHRVSKNLIIHFFSVFCCAMSCFLLVLLTYEVDCDILARKYLSGSYGPSKNINEIYILCTSPKHSLLYFPNLPHFPILSLALSSSPHITKHPSYMLWISPISIPSSLLILLYSAALFSLPSSYMQSWLFCLLQLSFQHVLLWWLHAIMYMKWGHIWSILLLEIC